MMEEEEEEEGPSFSGGGSSSSSSSSSSRCGGSASGSGSGSGIQQETMKTNTRTTSSSSSSRRRIIIPQDTIVYSIYPDSSLSPTLSFEEKTSESQSLHLSIISFIQPITSSYIWQHDPFHLSLTTRSSSSSSSCPCGFSSSSTVTPHLCGKIRFGDNLDDEWFVISLLFSISSQFPFLTVQITDSDGDPLLIESAFHLPSWLSPSTSTNRVFVRQSTVHILPLSVFPTNPPPLSDALRHLSLHPSPASSTVNSSILRRISPYPQRALSNIHTSRVRLPLRVALILRHEPSLISPAVESFYDRDIDSMKFASDMQVFGASSDDEMVTIAVRMSRTMYAQLVGQRFQAPKRYRMPDRANVSPAEYAEAELGMKIACGMEMMYQSRRREGGEGKGNTWEVYLESLKRSGYLEGLLPGSKEYSRRMEVAVDYYRKSSVFSRTSEILSAPVRRIDEILALPHSVGDFSSANLPPSDDDSWLYNGEDELNAELEERQKEMEMYEAERQKKISSRKSKGANHSSSSQANEFDLGDIVKSMQEFVHKVSSYEGAEVPKDRESKEVELNAERFFKEMESILGQVSQEDSPSGDDPKEDFTSFSDMEFDDSEDENDINDPIDEDNDDPFMSSYSNALNQELKETTLKKSFIRANEDTINNNEGTSNASKDGDEELTPVDVDINLVNSLLNSFSSQQGLPGPASNLLGLMGLELPKDTTKGK